MMTFELLYDKTAHSRQLLGYQQRLIVNSNSDGQQQRLTLTVGSRGLRPRLPLRFDVFELKLVPVSKGYWQGSSTKANNKR